MHSHPCSLVLFLLTKSKKLIKPCCRVMKQSGHAEEGLSPSPILDNLFSLRHFVLI